MSFIAINLSRNAKISTNLSLTRKIKRGFLWGIISVGELRGISSGVD